MTTLSRPDDWAAPPAADSCGVGIVIAIEANESKAIRSLIDSAPGRSRRGAPISGRSPGRSTRHPSRGAGRGPSPKGLPGRGVGLMFERASTAADRPSRIGVLSQPDQEWQPCGSVNATSTPRPTSCRRSRRGSLPTKSSSRRRSRPSRRNTKTGWPRSANETARRQGRSRRDFLRSGSGMAAALLALNQVFGDCYEVSADEVEDPQAFEEKWPKDQFVFDVQTHHVDVSHKWYDETPTGAASRSFFLHAPPRCQERWARPSSCLNRAHYVKEVFGDSDTVMSIISGVPSRDWDKNPLPPDQMVETRRFVNDLAGSRRVLSHGLLRPNLGKPELEEMERQVKDLKIDAWKMYTGAEIGEKAWRMDDEKVAYPFWEKTKALGIKNLCVHKGLPLGAFNEEACRPLDLEKAAIDWPDLNFIVYHSGFRGFGWLASGTGIKVVDPKSTDPQEIPWISDILRILKRNPQDQEHLFRAGQHVQHPVVGRAADLHAHARPDDPGRRRRPHPLGHRFDLERQPAEPDRADAPVQDRRRPDREVQISPADRRDQGSDPGPERRAAARRRSRRGPQGDQGRQAQRSCARAADTIPRRGATPSTAGSGSKTAATQRRRWGRDRGRMTSPGRDVNLRKIRGSPARLVALTPWPARPRSWS